MVHMNLKSSFFTPRSMGRASPPIVLPQPNGSSTRLRFCWLISYPEWRVVRPSMAERRAVVF